MQIGLLAEGPQVYVTAKGPGRREGEKSSVVCGRVRWEDFPAELCTASLPQHINTELCTPGPRWPWFIGLFHLTRARSFWKNSSTIYFAKEGRTGFKLSLKLTTQENHLLL